MNRDAFCQRLGYRFKQGALLDEALTHRSFGSRNYERLEFLGDSVLNCVIARALYERHPRLPEGQLSRLRASLVRQETLHRVALALDIGAVLRLGEGEQKSGGHARPSILADALEAVLGAIALEAGFDVAAGVTLALFKDALAAADAADPQKDPKTELQEWLQARRADLPQYVVIAVGGQAHAQQFEIECQISAPALATRGIGPSRRAAEQQAAARALEKLRS